LDVPIATGETTCTKYGFRQLIVKKSADIFLVDLQAAGGITEWMKIAGIAQAWNIPVTSHLFHEFSVHLLAATNKTDCFSNICRGATRYTGSHLL